MYTRKPGPYIEAYYKAIEDVANKPTLPPLVDQETGLRNSPTPGYSITCSDSGGVERELDEADLKAIVDKYSDLNGFSSSAAATEITCDGAKLNAARRLTSKFTFVYIGPFR